MEGPSAPVSLAPCEHSRRGVSGSSVLRLVAVMVAVFTGLALWPAQGLVPATPGHAQVGEPFLQPQPVVVASDRLVCSLLGDQKFALGVRGKDGTGTVEENGVVYWTFGDTRLANGTIIPNLVAWSTDHDASDCLDLKPKEAGGLPAPLLPREPSTELTVWPWGMEVTAPGQVHFFFGSVVPDARLAWRVTGVGIASFDTTTLASQRALEGALIWREGGPLPARTVADEDYVYIFLDISREPWTTDTILARVPNDSIEALANYEYWEPGKAGQPGRWRGGLWDEKTRSWDPALADIGPLWRQPSGHNGIDVAYNEFLGRWLAVYTTGFLSSVSVRSADELTGPWDDRETVLVRCPTFHPPPQQGFFCYTGAQHEFYSKDGGRTIYVSYSNWDSYQVYLHEIRLATAITQWSDKQGRAIYLTNVAQAPDGFSPDGLTFYASDIPVPSFAPIHRWRHPETGAIRYGADTPEPAAGYEDLGVDFYAPPDAAGAAATNALYAPVYRWTHQGTDRYSPLNLGPAGYTQKEVAFYAACPDADGDTLTDCLEVFLGTDAASADTDGDLLSDGYERTTPACDPLVYNDDEDGIPTPFELLMGTNACTADSDGDGCSDLQELGPDPGLGGGRDPLNPWDFFDVPDSANARDGLINGRDISRILAHYGISDANGTAPLNRSSDPLSPPSPEGTYHPAFDRSRRVNAQNEPSLGPPDGRVTGFEISSVLSQYGHSCRIPGR